MKLMTEGDTRSHLKLIDRISDLIFFTRELSHNGRFFFHRILLSQLRSLFSSFAYCIVWYLSISAAPLTA